MKVLVGVVDYFTMVCLGIKTKLRMLARHVLKAARRLLELLNFRFYALADGNQELLFDLKRA